MKGMELKFAYLNYIDSNLKECVRLIEKYIFFCLNNYLDLSKDPFWKKLAKDVFVAIILNEFYIPMEEKRYWQDIFVRFEEH